jgi:hypothetical protein
VISSNPITGKVHALAGSPTEECEYRARSDRSQSGVGPLPQSREAGHDDGEHSQRLGHAQERCAPFARPRRGRRRRCRGSKAPAGWQTTRWWPAPLERWQGHFEGGSPPRPPAFASRRTNKPTFIMTVLPSCSSINEIPPRNSRNRREALGTSSELGVSVGGEAEADHEPQRYERPRVLSRDHHRPPPAPSRSMNRTRSDRSRPTPSGNAPSSSGGRSVRFTQNVG